MPIRFYMKEFVDVQKFLYAYSFLHAKVYRSTHTFLYANSFAHEQFIDVHEFLSAFSFVYEKFYRFTRIPLREFFFI